MIISCIVAMVSNTLIVLIAGIALLAVLLFCTFRLQVPAFCFLYFILYCFSYAHAQNQLRPLSTDSMIDSVYGIEANIKGTVSQVNVKDTYVQVLVKDAILSVEQDSENAQNLTYLDTITVENISVMINVSACTAKEGDVIHANGTAKAFSTARNDGNFDSFSYYRSIGVAYKMSADSIDIVTYNQNEWLNMIVAFRERMKNVYDQIADEHDAGLLKSMLLADKSSLDESVSKLYQSSGISHILAISGLHISLIGMTIYRLLRRFGIPYLPCSIIGTILILSYGIMTGNGISTMRAIIMFILILIADVIGRTYDILSALSLSAIFLMYDNPLVLTNCGFLLSFGAILGMTVIYPAIATLLQLEEWKLKMKNLPSIRYSKEGSLKKECITGLALFSINAISAFLMSFAINLVTVPILLFFFFSVPLYSVFLNLLVIPLSTLLMLSSILAGLIGMVSILGGTFFVGISHYILLLYEVLCHFFEMLPLSTLVLGKPSLIRILVYSFLIFMIAVIVYLRRKNVAKNIPLYLVCTGLFIVAHLALLPVKSTNLNIYMLDVGQGDGLVVQTPEGTTYLFDGGSSDVTEVGKYRILPFLQSKAITTIDYAVVSHLDSDHTSGVIELLNGLQTNRSYQIKNLVLPDIKNAEEDEDYQSLVTLAKLFGVNVVYVTAQDTIGTASVQLTCLHPIENYAYQSVNDYSAVYLLAYQDFSMLFTGDVESAGEQSMLSNQMVSDVTVLKVAHHGSKTSSSESFLSACQPEISLISCGIKNRYGHPAEITMEHLLAQESRTYITTQCGQIRIETDGNSLKVWAKIETKEE